MANILAIETSTLYCSVAIVRDSLCFSKERLEEKYSHSELLHKFIEEVLKDAGIEFSELDAIAVSKGPGSYTGLRIGVSAAKGLAYSLGIPLIGIDTLKTMAMEVSQRDIAVNFLIPMLDARRMEVYCSVYDRELLEIQAVRAIEIDANSLKEFQEKGVIFGDGAKKVAEMHKGSGFELIENVWPKAEFTARLAMERFMEKDFDNTAYFEPFYLKDFIAGKPRDLLRE